MMHHLWSDQEPDLPVTLWGRCQTDGPGNSTVQCRGRSGYPPAGWRRCWRRAREWHWSPRLSSWHGMLRDTDPVGRSKPSFHGYQCPARGSSHTLWGWARVRPILGESLSDMPHYLGRRECSNTYRILLRISGLMHAKLVYYIYSTYRLFLTNASFISNGLSFTHSTTVIPACSNFVLATSKPLRKGGLGRTILY